MARKKRQELQLEPSGSYTFRDAFKFWCNKKKGRISSYRDEKLRLEKYIVSKIGNRQLDSINPPILIKLVEPIEAAGKQSTVKRLLMRTREIFDMAVNAGFLNSNPLAKITKVFATPEVRHMPSIDWKELPIVISQIEAKAPPKYRALFYFSLATLLRPGEVVSVRIDWISEEAITIPAEFKNKLVAHGLRSIGRSWFADNDVTFEVAEACLAHLVGSQVVRAYQRTDFFAPRQKVMLSWHAYIETCARCAQVLSQKPAESEAPD